jgi:hypothetical protein
MTIPYYILCLTEMQLFLQVIIVYLCVLLYPHVIKTSIESQIRGIQAM